MIKLSKEQIEELMELRNEFETQLHDLNEMSTQTDDTYFLNKVAKVKKGLIKNIKQYNQEIVDGLKKYDYEVPEYLYIRL